MEMLTRERQFDFTLFFSALALWIIGIALVYSATHVHEGGPLAGLYKSQIIWLLMGIVILLGIVSIPTRFYFTISYVVYGLSLLLLTAIIFVGETSKGAERWIRLGPVNFQPSEFAKIGLLLALARFLSSRRISLQRPASLVVPLLLIGVPFGLVMQQPDLGTAMIFCALSLPMFYWAGLSVVEIFFLVSPLISLVLSGLPLYLAFGTEESVSVLSAIPWGAFFVLLCLVLYMLKPPLFITGFFVAVNIVTAGVTTVVWNSVLQDYQKRRIISFINPQADPFGAGYQVIQSRVAIGSGHLFGKGYLKGTQTRLSFLPEQHTDFIFSVLGEQFGLVGSFCVIALFTFLLIRALLITRVIKNRFTNLLITGCVAIMAFHIFINIAMTLGMMPVTGVPLPFLSYGGTFTITIAVLVGFVLNARLYRQEF